MVRTVIFKTTFECLTAFRRKSTTVELTITQKSIPASQVAFHLHTLPLKILNDSKHNILGLGDASVSTVWLCVFAARNWDPYSAPSPEYMTPGHIKRLTPQAKIILMVRNPTTRSVEITLHNVHA